ncbi:MAG: hypothetical protein DMF68_08740 [Acidobacteria bacterium]|nr:MAG: hypothetical protein DMF68_08740 [Acidobacteriota bacterium]
MKKVFVVFALALLTFTSTGVLAQGNDPAITATRVFGKIAEINAPAGQMTVKTDAGSVVTVSVNDKTTYERMPPGETDRSKATKITLTDIATGDGVYARGYVAADRKSVPAQDVIVVSQSDIAKKQEKERLEWRQRGLSGVIASLNPQTKEITVTTRAAAGSVPVIVPVTDKVRLRRYAPDSIKFSDAKKSSFEELKVGDQLRAKGDKSEDGSHFAAEEIVTGSFRTVGGSVVSVDPAASEIKLNDIQTKQPLTVVVRKETILKRIPPEFMQMMMSMGPGGPGGAGGQAPQGGQKPAGAPTTGGPPTAGGQGGPPGGGFDIQRIIDNLPAATLADLKPGEMILLSSSTGADPTRVTAITLVAGVEPIFTMLQAMQARQAGAANRPLNLGTINIGIGGP